MDFNFQDQLGRLLGMTHQAMRRQLNRRLVERGGMVTGDQLIIIICLSRHDGLSQKLIAEICGKDKTSTTRMIDTMEKHELVRRVPDKVDRRQNMIYLTDKGRQIFENMLPLIEATHVQAQRGVSPEELQVCKRVLKEVLTNLIETDPDWPMPFVDESDLPSLIDKRSKNNR